MRAFIHFAALALFAVSAHAVPPAAPSGVIAYAPNEDRVHLAWFDNSNDETGFKVQRFNFTTSTWEDAADLPQNFDAYRAEAPSSASQLVRYRVAAVKGAESSAWAEAEVLKPAGNLDLFHDLSRNDPVTGQPPLEIPEGTGLSAGEQISIQIEVFNGTPDRFIAESLPAGLSLNSDSGVISGTVQAPGVYRILNGVEFDSGKRFQQVRFLRVLPAPSTPVVATPLELPVQTVGAEGFIDISGLFADPARPLGTWIFLGGESIIIALFDTATPRTTANFLNYVFNGNYDGTYVHYALSGFIIQGGGFGAASATAAPNEWAAVGRRTAVFNEPGIPNFRGTISMAKTTGVRDGASSEWFFNVGNENPAHLDYQNGGFTPFGAVVGGRSMFIVDTTANLSKGNYNISVQDLGSAVFQSVPVLDAIPPATLGPASLLRIDSMRLCPPVEISIVGNSAPAVVEAGILGMFLYLKSMGPMGTSTLQLRATNLDGNTVDFHLPVRVDDQISPALKVLSLRLSKSSGKARVKARATDTNDLASWRYRINGQRWVSGGRLIGKTAVFSKLIGGFKQGKNRIEFEVIDARGNRSGIARKNLKFD